MWSSLLIISFVKSVKSSSQLAVDARAIKDTCCNASEQSRERKLEIIARVRFRTASEAVTRSSLLHRLATRSMSSCVRFTVSKVWVSPKRLL